MPRPWPVFRDARKSEIDDDMSDSNLETVYGNNKVNRSSATGLRMPHSTEVPSEIVRKWQEIVNLLAEIIHVPSALIMRVEPPNIKVFVSSDSKGNPYEQNEVSQYGALLRDRHEHPQTAACPGRPD